MVVAAGPCVAVLVGVLLGAGVLVQRLGGQPSKGTGSTSAGGQNGLAAPKPVTDSPSLPAEVIDPVVRRNSIERLLRDRADALLLGDATIWSREQVPLAAVPRFSRITVLAPVSYEYSVTSVTSDSDPTQATVSALVRYRLPMDAAVATFREDLALQHSDTGWRIAAEHSVGRKPVWELGDISVLIGQRTTVIGIDQTHEVLQRYLGVGDAVIPAVTKDWGTDWTQRLVIIVPKTGIQIEKGLGRSRASLEDIAAVTSMDTASGDPGSPRIWLNTPTMQGLSSLGREIVLRHEVVHVATGSGSTDATPLWLEEGLAEYIGYQDSGVSRAVAAADVVDALRDGENFDHLPGADDFSGPDLNIAYESALIACDELADDGGIAELVRTYRLTSEGTGSSDENLAAAIHEVYGISVEDFVRHWNARLHQVAGLPFAQEAALDNSAAAPERTQVPSGPSTAGSTPASSPSP